MHVMMIEHLYLVEKTAHWRCNYTLKHLKQQTKTLILLTKNLSENVHNVKKNLHWGKVVMTY